MFCYMLYTFLKNNFNGYFDVSIIFFDNIEDKKLFINK